MKVKIHDLTNHTVYTATCEKDCKDTTDRSAYQEAIKGNECVKMGMVIAEPIGFNSGKTN